MNIKDDPIYQFNERQDERMRAEYFPCPHTGRKCPPYCLTAVGGCGADDGNYADTPMFLKKQAM